MIYKSEAAVQAAIRVRASEIGVHLFRNNVGACTDQTGRMIRYGLANDSAQMQRRIKSADLVGWVPMQAIAVEFPKAPDYCATTPAELNIFRRDAELWRTIRRGNTFNFAVFLCVECKRSDWFEDFTDPLTQCRDKFNDREEAQAKWIDMVRKDGGVAGFCRSVAEFEALLT